MSKGFVSKISILLALVFLTAACGSQSKPAPSQSSSQPAQTSTPAATPAPAPKPAAPAKDTLVVANAVEIPTFDPQQVLGIDAIVAVANIYDRLIYMDVDGSFHPWLATKWEVSTDGRTWTFFMRKDAKFHDGSPVTSAAVKYSIERAIKPGSPSSLSKTYLNMITKIETPDDYTVAISTKEPFGPMLNHIGHQTVSTILNPKVVEANGGKLTDPVSAGSGMYKLVEWKRGEHLILERNEEWWGPKPAFKRIIYRPVPDPATRQLMLEKGEVDIATVLPLHEVPNLAKNKEIKLNEINSIRSMFFFFNMNNPTMKDVRIRQAINYAVDVNAIIKAVLSGKGVPAKSVVAPNLKYFAPVHNFAYDPAKAKALLAEAGIKPGTKISIQSPQGRWPGDVELAQAVGGYLKEIGLEPDIRIFGDWAKFLESRKDPSLHLIMIAWAPGSLDADGIFSGVFLTNGNNNYGNYSSAEADKLIKAAVSTVKDDERTAAYKQVQDLLNKDLPYLLLHNGVTYSGVRSNICGVAVRGDEAHILKDAKVCN